MFAVLISMHEPERSTTDTCEEEEEFNAGGGGVKRETITKPEHFLHQFDFDLLTNRWRSIKVQLNLIHQLK